MTSWTSSLRVAGSLLLLGGCCEPEIVAGVPNDLAPQETNNWCWAAVTEMLADSQGVNVAQCDLANHRFGLDTCCELQDESVSTCRKTNECNMPGWLELDYAGLTFSDTGTARSFASLQDEIYCKQKPMGYAYGTPGVVGHVVVIKGYATIGGTDYVVLDDPWAPCVGSQRIITYDEYADPVGSSEHWTTFYNVALPTETGS